MTEEELARMSAAALAGALSAPSNRTVFASMLYPSFEWIVTPLPLERVSWPPGRKRGRE